MPDFDSYLDRVTEHIRDPKKQCEVRAELFSHLDEMTEYYAESGMTHEEAARKAIDDMGDAHDLSYKLGEIHSFFPAKDLRNSITLFITGFLLVSFNIDIWYLKPITTGIGSVLIFIALGKLSVCGNLFKLSYIIFTAAILFGITVESFSALPLSRNAGTWLTVVQYIIVPFGAPTAYILAISGITRLLPEDNRMGLKTSAWLYGIVTIVVMTAGAGILFFLFAVIIAVCSLGNARQYLWANGWDGGIKESSGKKTAVKICSALFVLAIPYIISAAVTLLPVSGEVYCRGEETENVRAVSRKLIENGADAELFADMRFDDILLLDGAKPSGKYTLYASLTTGEATECELYPFEKDNGCTYVLRYRHTEAPQSSRAAKLRLCFRDPDGGYYALMPGDSLVFCHAVSLFEKNGVTMCGSTYTSANESFLTAEYKLIRNVEAQHGYVIFSVYSPEITPECDIYYLTQKDIIRIPFNSDAEYIPGGWANSRQWDMPFNWIIDPSDFEASSYTVNTD